MRFIQWIINNVVLAWWAIEFRWLHAWYRVVKAWRKFIQPPKRNPLVTLNLDIGPGRDFKTLADALQWLEHIDLVKSNTSVVLSTFANQTFPPEHNPTFFNAGKLVVLKPGPGLALLEVQSCDSPTDGHTFDTLHLGSNRPT